MIIAHTVSSLISEFRCLSGTSRYNVGQFIGTSGVDIVSNTTDPFLIRRGSANNPGLIHVRNSRTLAAEYEGVYTCQIPDESGTMARVNVGLYLHGIKGKQLLTSLKNVLWNTCSSHCPEYKSEYHRPCVHAHLQLHWFPGY